MVQLKVNRRNLEVVNIRQEGTHMKDTVSNLRGISNKIRINIIEMLYAEFRSSEGSLSQWKF